MIGTAHEISGAQVHTTENGQIPDPLRPYIFHKAHRTCFTGPFGHLLVQEQSWKGFTLIHSTAIVEAPVELVMNAGGALLHVVYSIQGTLSWRFKRMGAFTCHPGQYTLQHHPTGEGKILMASPGIYECFTIRFTAEYLFGLLLGRHILEPLSDAIAKKIPHTMGPARHFYQTIPLMEDIPHQLFACPLQSSCRRTYTIGKVAQYFALVVSELTSRPYLTREERQQIQQVGELLADDPGSVTEITHLVEITGLPPKKLAAGFKEIFGRTFKNYLSNQKSEANKRLLYEDDH